MSKHCVIREATLNVQSNLTPVHSPADISRALSGLELFPDWQPQAPSNPLPPFYKY